MKGNHSLKAFFTIWIGQAFSLLGSNLVQFALIWWLTKTTGSATVLALASLVGLLPQVVLGPFVGVLVDRWPRRTVMLLADATVALATLLLAYLYWLGAAETWHVFAILFIRALGGSFHWPAMQAATALMVPEQQLTRIQGLNQMLNGGLGIVAAPLGALLLEVMPMQGVLAIDVGTALLAITPLLFIAIPEPPRAEAEAGAPVASFWSDLRDGLSYVRAWPGLLVLLGMAALINLLLHPAFALVPILVTEHFGGQALELGWMESAAAAGIVVGGLALSAWGGFRRRIHTTLLGVTGIGLSVLLVGLAPASFFWLAVAGLFLAGTMIALTDGPIFAILQAAVDPEMQGRVFMLLGSAAKIVAPLGLVIAGPLSDLLGVRTWFLAAGTLAIVVGIASFFSPVLLNIEEKERPATATVVGDSLPEAVV